MASSCLVARKVALWHLSHQPMQKNMQPAGSPVGVLGGHGAAFPCLKSISGRSCGAHRPGTRSRTLSIQAAVVKKQESPSKFRTGTWTWSFEKKPVKIYFEEHKQNVSGPCKDIIMLPTISDVSTIDEWQAVVKDLLTRELAVNWWTVIVDWPGFGFSYRPSIRYNADMMENFLVDFICAADSLFKSSETERVIVGGGHAATIALCGATKGLVNASAIVAVAPNWAGPLPIVFGRGSGMETSVFE